MKKNDFKPIQKKKKPAPKKVVETGTKKVKDTSVVYKPFPGPQTEFLKSNEDFVLFAGGRGSGKSLAIFVNLRFNCLFSPNFLTELSVYLVGS